MTVGNNMRIRWITDIESATGELNRSEQGNVVAHIAFDAGTTKPIINLLLSSFWKEGVIAAAP